MKILRKAIFLDKDGTLIIDVPYNIDPDLITLSNNCLPGLIKLQENGYLFILVTNQAGAARGFFKEEELNAVHLKIKALMAQAGIVLNGFYYCPHHPEGIIKSLAIECDCRKPAPGLLLKAATELSIDLNASWMIGDILNDIEAGNRAGCRSILIDNGNETEWQINQMRIPLFKVKTINEAADHILKEDVRRLAAM